MEREELRKRLMDLVDGDLPDEEARRVEAAVEGDPELRKELEDLREAVRLARCLGDVEVPENLTDEIRRAIDMDAGREVRPVRVFPYWILGAAAAAVLVLALGVSLLRRGEQASLDPDQDAARRVAVTDNLKTNSSEPSLPASRAKRSEKAWEEDVVEEAELEETSVARNVRARRGAEPAGVAGTRQPDPALQEKLSLLSKKVKSATETADKKTRSTSRARVSPPGIRAEAQSEKTAARRTRKAEEVAKAGRRNRAAVKDPAKEQKQETGQRPGSAGPEEMARESQKDGLAPQTKKKESTSRSAPPSFHDNQADRSPAADAAGKKGRTQDGFLVSPEPSQSGSGRKDFRVPDATVTLVVETSRAMAAGETLVRFLVEAGVEARYAPAAAQPTGSTGREVRDVRMDLALTQRQSEKLVVLLKRLGELEMQTATRRLRGDRVARDREFADRLDKVQDVRPAGSVAPSPTSRDGDASKTQPTAPTPAGGYIVRKPGRVFPKPATPSAPTAPTAPPTPPAPTALAAPATPDAASPTPDQGPSTARENNAREDVVGRAEAAGKGKGKEKEKEKEKGKVSLAGQSELPDAPSTPRETADAGERARRPEVPSRPSTAVQPEPIRIWTLILRQR